tara:strand:- start:32249 stop:33091 length:843 start_codon:yes stop_codon:yes gene_type:complete
MFSTEQISEHLETLRADGFIEIEQGFTEAELAAVNSIIERPLNQLTINGTRGYVQQSNIRYLFQTFTWGKPIIDLYTKKSVIDLAAAYSGEDVHISNHRIYRSYPSRRKVMHWHVDNKIDTFDPDKRQFITHQAPIDKGLIMIAYLSDVHEGGTQMIKASHKWGKFDKESWSEAEINANDGEIVTFNNRKAGTVLLYDYRVIHRAQPYKYRPLRTSLFAQYSPTAMPVGEPIYLSSQDINLLTDLQKRVLNFGASPSTENWPIGSKLQNALDFCRYFFRE